MRNFFERERKKLQKKDRNLRRLFSNTRVYRNVNLPKAKKYKDTHIYKYIIKWRKEEW